MGRGVSCGGGQSSLGYLFGSNEAPKPAKENAPSASTESKATNKPNAVPQPVDISKQIPAGIHSSTTNNYVRADGQNTCNFITVDGLIDQVDKGACCPGGGSSLGYLFGGGSN
ncbi:hypothetical protein DH2020_032540 [Rehmannia glutinosa]|uniref:Uncharacterized protein n=1 Tax=Rehmannia glutinosa TaxID=99300 RepID=A0ABR0VIJ7_REHGL